MTNAELEFWKQVYVAYVASHRGCIPVYREAAKEADQAVKELRGRQNETYRPYASPDYLSC